MTDNRPIRVVYIDDEPDCIEIAKLILSRQVHPETGEPQYDVHSAGSGHEGLALIQQIQPDVVLLDAVLSDMDAWEVYQQIRGNNVTKDLPIVIAVPKGGWNKEFVKVLGDYTKNYDSIKPLDPKDLVRGIQRVLNPIRPK